MPAPVIIVTGVSRGIGRAIAEELQSRGAVVVGAARNVAEVPASATLLPVAADVTQETGRRRNAFEAQALLALVYAAHKQPGQTRHILLTLLAYTCTEGYLRLLLDEGEAMAVV